MEDRVSETGKKAFPTMIDVARQAGVSVMTVSRVMNGQRVVSETTRCKVAAAVAALRYAPNQEARKLVGRSPVRIGFFYSDPGDGFLSEFLVSLINQSAHYNVQLVVEKCEGDAGEVRTRHLTGRALDGIILAAPLCDSQAVIDFAAGANIPAVAVNCERPDERLGAICIDDYDGSYRMTRHLILLGHRRIGFVAGPPNRPSSMRRLAGYRAAVQAYGADRSEQLVVQGMLTYLSGLRAAERLLAAADHPTAIFASNDDMAAGAIAAALRCGLEVPGDLTVAGFGDGAIATAIWPELTTLRQPIADMAHSAVQSLVQRVRALREGIDLQPERISMAFELVRRQSDAIPRRVMALTGNAG
jgi:LacI family transcriptional regulator